MFRELHKATRRLPNRPGHSALSIGVLGLGLGSMLLMLSLVNGLMLEPFPQSDRLVAIGYQNAGDSHVEGMGTEDFQLLAPQLHSIEVLGVYLSLTVNIRQSGNDAIPKRYDGTALSREMPDLLGVAPVIGRSIQPEDDQPGAELWLWLGERVWRQDFRADPHVVGMDVQANGERATIRGVMPANFAFPYTGEVFVGRRMQNGDELGGDVAARLKPGGVGATGEQRTGDRGTAIGQEPARTA